MTTDRVFRLIKCRIHCILYINTGIRVYNHTFSNNSFNQLQNIATNTHTHTDINANAQLYPPAIHFLPPLHKTERMQATPYDRGNDNKDTRVDFHVDYILENCKVV